MTQTERRVLRLKEVVIKSFISGIVMGVLLALQLVFSLQIVLFIAVTVFIGWRTYHWKTKDVSLSRFSSIRRLQLYEIDKLGDSWPLYEWRQNMRTKAGMLQGALSLALVLSALYQLDHIALPMTVPASLSFIALAMLSTGAIVFVSGFQLDRSDTITAYKENKIITGVIIVFIVLFALLTVIGIVDQTTT
ncbi:hypothetical protein [Alkalicoccus luteus]|uniref:hypothetical protein n=1 Tax=Alkalicoccus luteus TaxID=1237094 RepID=UPI0040339973